MRLPAKLKKTTSRLEPKVSVFSGRIRPPTPQLDRLAVDLAKEWDHDSRAAE